MWKDVVLRLSEAPLILFSMGGWCVSSPSRLVTFRLRLSFCMSSNRSLSAANRSEEHTSELQSHLNLVCRLLLEKKKNTDNEVNKDTLESHSRTYGLDIDGTLRPVLLLAFHGDFRETTEHFIVYTYWTSTQTWPH